VAPFIRFLLRSFLERFQHLIKRTRELRGGGGGRKVFLTPPFVLKYRDVTCKRQAAASPSFNLARLEDCARRYFIYLFLKKENGERSLGAIVTRSKCQVGFLKNFLLTAHYVETKKQTVADDDFLLK
jgi:hypothetical protein